MASNFAFCYLLLLLSSTLFITIRAARPYEQPNLPKPSGGISVDLVSSVLSDKGYHAMSLTLEAVLEALTPTHFINHNTTLTLFCPQDQAFLNSKYPRPPLTLLRYHVVPFKIDKDTMEATFHHGSMVDTLLPGHPLVVTSAPGTGRYASLNLVKVTEWDLYNDGRLIIHGVEDFFDPAFQILRYPIYDVINIQENPREGFSMLKDALEIISLFILLALVAAFTYVLIRSFIFPQKPRDGEYALLY
ncbi:hypothetical protein GBA52_004739 [Prunus armeniaca]|nr:hypothetical protein GBA52_004739 [Prunus armeniaca]